MRWLRQGVGARTVLFLTALVTFSIIPAHAVEAACQSPAIMFGRYKWCGYFYNNFQNSGDDVRAGGVPASVNNATEFINMVISDWSSTNQHRKTAGAFIIRTMTGQPLPNLADGAAKPVTTAMINDFRSRVQSYANTSQNGTTSVGSNGRIDWFVSWRPPCGTYNSYYQPSHRDVAPYVDTASNSNCENSSASPSQFIYFRNSAGTPIYVIRRICMNPMGTLQALSATPPPNYSLQPSVAASVNGAAVSSAEPGETVRFTYTVNNAGTTASASTNCTLQAQSYEGYYQLPDANNPPVWGAYTGPPGACPFTLAASGTYTVATEDVPIPPDGGNQTICRSLAVTPATPAGITRTRGYCLVVANKPYVKVFGGDIVAGSTLTDATGTCTPTAGAAIAGWNKRSDAANPWAGAGSQYAALAMGVVRDFASTQAASGAPAPSGLTFNNQVTAAQQSSGQFGGNIGGVACIPDYYGTLPEDASALTSPINVSPLSGDGVYRASGTTTITGGNINPNDRTALFVDGDVFISDNILYQGNWNLSTIPFFELVVRGNIYISPEVTQLDGAFIAQQRTDGTGGYIYTCATAAAALPLDGNLYDTCNEKLTVNGSLVANRLYLMRTFGSLALGTTDETAAGDAAEIINYNPVLWIAQPTGIVNAVPDDYDSIANLPPVL